MSKAIVVKAPASFGEQKHLDRVALFLSGPGGDWRDRVKLALADLPILILDPWRDDWDEAWGGKDPRFMEQVDWELLGLEVAEMTLVVITAEALARVTLLELGLMIGQSPHDVVVCCSPGYSLYDRVHATCAWRGAQLYEEMDHALQHVRNILQRLLDEKARKI